MKIQDASMAKKLSYFVQFKGYLLGKKFNGQQILGTLPLSSSANIKKMEMWSIYFNFLIIEFRV